MSLPDVTVEIAFTTSPDDPAPDWVDVSDYVNAESSITITRGRSSEDGQVQPSSCSLTLDNADGRFTPGNTSGAYYPNVKLMRRIRVRATAGATTYDRFLGYVIEWPVAWDAGVAATSTVTITAVSRQARIGNRLPLRSMVEEEILEDDPYAYYTLGEPEGATSASDGSGNSRPALRQGGNGTAVTFGTATGPGTDSLTAATFADGKFLTRSYDAAFVSGTSTTITFGVTFNTSAAGDQTIATVMSDDNGGTDYIRLGILNAGGQLLEAVSTGVSSYELLGPDVNDGQTHVAAIRETLSGGTVTVDLLLDGVVVDSDTDAATGPHNLRRFTVGGEPNGNKFTGTLSHAFVAASAIADARLLEQSNAALTGFEGESSDERIERLARYAGYATADVDTETGNTTSVDFEDTTGKTAAEAMQDVVATEDGMLFDGRDGVLTFHARSHRWNPTAAVTLDASVDEVGADLNPSLDNSAIINDVTVSTPGGYSLRVTDDDSIEDYGVVRRDEELLLTDEGEVDDRANWRIYARATPAVRVPSVTVDVVNSSDSQTAALLALELGDSITLDNLPDQAPASSMSFFVEGYTETIGGADYVMTLNVSPVGVEDGVWTIGDATYGAFDSNALTY